MWQRKRKLRVWCLSQVPAILFCRGKASTCVDSLLMTKLEPVFPLPLLSNQICCGKTPIRPREGTQCSPPFCGTRWVCLVMGFLENARLTNAYMYCATLKIWDRPSKEHVQLLLVLVSRFPTTQDTADTELAAEFGLETLEHAPHSPDLGPAYYHLFTT